jgi:exopolysaccharide biosynthesis polyprenyl glycosylphosphotransferase
MTDSTALSSASRDLEILTAGAPARPLLGYRRSHRDYIARRLLAVGDVTAILISEAVWLSFIHTTGGLQHLGWSLLLLPVWLLIFRGYGLYERDSKRVSHRTIDDVPWLVHGIVAGCVLLWAWFKLGPVESVHFADLAVIGIVTLLLAIIFRQFVRWVVVTRLAPERVLVMGDARLTELLARKMHSHPEYGLDPVGVLEVSEDSISDSALPVLGSLRTVNLAEFLATHRIDRVLVSHVEIDESDLVGVLHQCRRQGIKMTVVPRLFDALGPSVEMDDVEGITVLGINPPVLSRSSRAIKRATDIVGAVTTIVLTSPVLLAIAIAIKLDSRGPLLFRQQRIGRGGRRFWVLKFRTMVPDAERLRADLLTQSTDPNWLKLDHDPRITRVGGRLRMASLDELPQLWNVLKGEMSLVGPRPLIESEDHQLEEWARARIDLTPGLTGLWQVLGRTNIPFNEMAKLDYVYVTNWTLWGDIRLLVKTLPVVLSRRGAN